MSGAIRAVVTAWCVVLVMAGCGKSDPWVELEPDEPVHSFTEIPFNSLLEETDKYTGAVFEDRFKFYRIYHDKETSDPTKMEQVIEGETHFTARPIQNYVNVVRIRITPEQEAWIRKEGIRRQDAIQARVRLAGFAPSGVLAFELLEIQESIRSKRLKRTGE